MSGSIPSRGAVFWGSQFSFLPQRNQHALCPPPRPVSPGYPHLVMREVFCEVGGVMAIIATGSTSQELCLCF